MKLSKVLSDCVTGLDGLTVDPARVYFMVAFVFFIAASIVVLVNEKKIDLLQWSAAFAAFCVGGTGGIYIKNSTEPNKNK